MTAVNPDVSRQAVVEAALVLLERMGLTRRTWPPSRRLRPPSGPVAQPPVKNELETVRLLVNGRLSMDTV